MESSLDLSVSVVTYNSEDYLEGLFASLSAQEGVSWELFLVDNASSDETGNILARRGMGQVTRNPGNIGYGRAHNQNRSRFRGRYILVLNPDIVLPRGLFAAIVKLMDEDPALAIAGPMILEGAERVPFPPRRFYPGEAAVPLEPALDRKDFAWVNGCCFAIRKTVFDELAGFDGDFFLYCEDTDLCWRARHEGHRIGWLPEYAVVHHGRGSQRGVSEYRKARALFEGAALFWEKRYLERDLPSLFFFQAWAAQALLTASTLRANPWRRRLWSNGERLRARRDVCREWLRAHRHRLLILDPGIWRMAGRHLRLFAEWLRRGGRLPFDDY